MNKIAIWSADIGSEHGQGIVTEYVLNFVLPKIGATSSFRYKAGFGVVALYRWIYCVIKIWVFCLINKNAIVYAVCSRSTLGFIRDIPILFLSRAGRKVIIHSHGGDIYDLLGKRWYSKLSKFLYRKGFLIVSNKPLENMCLNLIPNVYTLENYISSDARDSRVICRKDQFIVGWNSNVMASKGFFICAEAIRLANDLGHDVAFKSIGRLLPDQDMSQNELNSEFSKYLKHSWFEYCGPVSQQDSINFIKDCDAIALLSKSEAQPFAIIEAMCTGTYVIVSDIPALTFTIGDYPATVVKLGSVNDMLQAIIKLKAVVERRDEKLIRDLTIASDAAKLRFSSTRFSIGMKDIFDEVIDNNL